MGGFDFCDAKMLREGCFKKYIQAPLIGMRIWFGLILKITVWTKSYISLKKKPLFCKITRITSEIITLFRVPPQLFLRIDFRDIDKLVKTEYV